VVCIHFIAFFLHQFVHFIDLDKNYNDKLCLEYELTASPVHLTTTDECILAALRKLASLEQQVKTKKESPHSNQIFERAADCKTNEVFLAKFTHIHPTLHLRCR
jgi:hypothetical protein